MAREPTEQPARASRAAPAAAAADPSPVAEPDLPALSEGVPDADFTVPFNGHTLTFRAGIAFTAHRDLRAFLAENGCAVTWSTD